MSAEELEAYAKESEEKRLMLRRANNSNWHYKKMAEDYADYIEAAHERVKRSRANNPELERKTKAKRAAKDLAEKRYHCERCDLSFTTQHILNDHLQTPKHHRKALEHLNPYRCTPCNLGFHNQSNLTRHQLSKRHADNLKAFRAKRKAEELAVQAEGNTAFAENPHEDKENAVRAELKAAFAEDPYEDKESAVGPVEDQAEGNAFFTEDPQEDKENAFAKARDQAKEPGLKVVKALSQAKGKSSRAKHMLKGKSPRANQTLITAFMRKL